MRIGVVVDNTFDNDHRVQKEIRLLLDQGHQVSVLCLDFGDSYKTYHKFEVRRVTINENLKNALVILNTNFSFYNRFWLKHISNFITEENLETLHVHDLYLAKPGRLGIQKSKKEIPLTLDLHENYPAAIATYQWATKGWRKYLVTPKKWGKLEAEYLKYADYWITLSNAFKNELLEKYSFMVRNRVFVHPNMPDLESFEAFEASNLQVNFTSEVPTLFYFGVVAKRRGIIDILPWLKDLKEEGLAFHILIIGPIDKADKNQFENAIASLGDAATYISWSDVKFLPAYLKKINIGLAPFEVNPQHDSGVANKLFQYMYGQIPILATACKAQKELIENSNCGLVYTDEKDFKVKLKQLLASNTLREQLGVNGKKELLKLYNEKADQAFLKIYQSTN